MEKEEEALGVRFSLSSKDVTHFFLLFSLQNLFNLFFHMKLFVAFSTYSDL